MTPIKKARPRPPCASGRAMILELRNIVRDYWEPVTRRGVVAKERVLERAQQFIDRKEPL